VLRRPIEPGCYTSLDFTNAATLAGLEVSFGSTGDCFDNAAMETVWSIIKREITWIRGSCFFATREEAKLYLFEFIETPHQRIESSGCLANRVEGFARVVVLTGDEAMVELPEQLVEEIT
jgi:transposase InsO family protein